MEGAPPALREIVSECIREEIVSCEMSAGSKPGDNVIGKMLSVTLKTKSTETLYLIVKASIPFRHDHEMELTYDEKMFARLVLLFGSYQTELAYYQRIQPEMEFLTLTEGYSLPTPKFVFGSIDEETGIDSCLVLEDLRPVGYKMADKMKGLTKDEVMMVLEKLARFHAASYIHIKSTHVELNYKHDPLTYHVFDKSALGMPEFEKIHNQLIAQICFNTVDLAKRTGVISEALYNKIVNLTADPEKTIISYSKVAAQEYFPVVVHGDLWVNNILFKYDLQGKPVDVKFIDFQQCRYSSVYDDLHYFFYTSTTTDFRKNNLDACLNFYHEKFQETLTSLSGNSFECKVMANFTREVFRQGFLENLAYAFCYGTLAFPFQLGIPVPAEEKTEKNKANQKVETKLSRDYTEAGLMQFATKFFHQMTQNLQAAMENSPEALKRYGEFCHEMDQLNVFNNKFS